MFVNLGRIEYHGVIVKSKVLFIDQIYLNSFFLSLFFQRQLQVSVSSLKHKIPDFQSSWINQCSSGVILCEVKYNIFAL